MNKLMLAAMILIFSGCANYSTNVNNLMGGKKFEKDESVNIRGYIYIDYGDINLYHEKSGIEHIDVAFDKDMTFDKPLREEKYICVDLVGEYTQYQKGSIRIGNATSNHGVIVATDIKRCKQI